ncbi:MAG: hypothetical protein KDJ15_07835, partial [Alphaproteobacteria bacterium]|nr:hypothetical protein [Alphaproteobacteria bacterium]
GFGPLVDKPLGDRARAWVTERFEQNVAMLPDAAREGMQSVLPLAGAVLEKPVQNMTEGEQKIVDGIATTVDLGSGVIPGKQMGLFRWGNDVLRAAKGLLPDFMKAARSPGIQAAVQTAESGLTGEKKMGLANVLSKLFTKKAGEGARVFSPGKTAAVAGVGAYGANTAFEATTGEPGNNPFIPDVASHLVPEAIRNNPIVNFLGGLNDETGGMLGYGALAMGAMAFFNGGISGVGKLIAGSVLLLSIATVAGKALGVDFSGVVNNPAQTQASSAPRLAVAARAANANTLAPNGGLENDQSTPAVVRANSMAMAM